MWRGASAAAALLLCISAGRAAGEVVAFPEVVEECAGGASRGRRCAGQIQAAAAPEECERGYCECKGELWRDGRCTPAVRHGCGPVLELCAVQYLECSYASARALLAQEDCALSGVQTCAAQASRALRAACRGEGPRASWMHDVCDKDSVCAGSTYSPIGFLALLLTFLTICLS